MTIQEIRELVQVVTESGIAEIEVERGDNRVHIKRTHGVAQEVVFSQAPPAQQTVQYVHQPHPAAQAPQHAAAADSSMQTIKAPIVGTFYEAASPDSTPFVKVGDTVKAGQVLCIIESMKLMNEIESDFGGVIAAKLVENGSPVEYGEALFAIRSN
jgi:acetyl-CoA carboxylase biotin carboxyl carrier protein